MAVRPVVLGAVLAVAALTGVDAVEEYIPLIAADRGVPTAWIPPAVLVVPLAGAAGAVLAGRFGRLTPGGIGVATGLAATALAIAVVVDHPVALLAVGLFYGLYRFSLVAVDARLQERITGPARATVTSIAGLLTDVASLGLYGLWAVGGLPAVTAALAVIAVVLPPLLHVRRDVRRDGRGTGRGTVRGTGRGTA